MTANPTPNDSPVQRSPKRRLRPWLALLAACAAFVPALTALAPGVAGAALPDNPAQPVNFGDAGFFGPAGGLTLNAPAVAMAATPSGNGYWIVASDGGIFNYGDAGFFGSAGGIHLNKPIVGMARTADGGGYWLVASDGGIFSYGDATFYGSTGGIHLNKPVVGMAATPDGHGYWLVASDGGIFAYGDAGFYGSTGAIQLNKPIVGMAATADGNGYWLVASDGGIFAYGDAPFLGSMGGTPLNAPIVAMAASGAAATGWPPPTAVSSPTATPFDGSMGGQSNPNPITDIVATPSGNGYWLLPTTPAARSTHGGLRDRRARPWWRCNTSSPHSATGSTRRAVSSTTAPQQAVWALQKAAGLPRDGVVGPDTWAALSGGVVPQPRTTSGYVIEINLALDLLMVVDNGHLEWTLNTSTGGGYTYSRTA